MLFFLVTPKQAFLHPILNVLDNNFAVSLAVLYPLVVLFLFLSRMVKHKLERTAFDIVIVSVILIMAIGLALLKSDAMAKTFWKINYYAQNRNWEKLVDVYEKHLTANPQIQFQVNRALCLLDKIGDEFFRYNTTYNRRTFFLIDEELLSSPLVYSDYFFDLHHFVESKHWAYEALSVKGETGRILQRLAEVSLIEGRFKLAQEYLTKLTTTTLPEGNPGAAAGKCRCPGFLFHRITGFKKTGPVCTRSAKICRSKKGCASTPLPGGAALLLYSTNPE